MSRRRPFGFVHFPAHRRSIWLPVLARVISTVITLTVLTVALLLAFGLTWWVVLPLTAGYVLAGVALALLTGRVIAHRDTQRPTTDAPEVGTDEH